MAEFARLPLDKSWIETLEGDLAAVNGGKTGRPFQFSDAMIRWAIRTRTVLRISYRLTLGLLNAFLEDAGIPGMSLSQLYHRCRTLSGIRDVGDGVLASGSCDVTVSTEPIQVAVDSTGLSLGKYGGWLCHHWDMKAVSGWIKLHAAVDPDTDRVLAYVVSDEKCGDVSCLETLVDLARGSGHNVVKILADAAYDKKAIWSKYAAEGIEVAINIKSSQLDKHKSSCPGGIRAHGCMPRARQMGAHPGNRPRRMEGPDRIRQTLEGGMHVFGSEETFRERPQIQEEGDERRGNDLEGRCDQRIQGNQDEVWQSYTNYRTQFNDNGNEYVRMRKKIWFA